MLFFIQAAAMGAWFVPMGSILDAHGLQSIKPVAFATSAMAAFVSPLIFGAMADRHFAPERLLRWLAVATAGAILLAATAIEKGAPAWLVLVCILLHALCAAPTWGISSSIVLGRLSNAHRQFGPIRSLASIGWMIGCWLVSSLRADTSTHAWYAAAAVWLLVVGLTFWLPTNTPPKSTERLSIPQRLGWDALSLLKIRDHRVIFLTTALFSIPLAAFYPYTPTHLLELGLERTSAWMTLGQTTEIVAMFALASIITRFRLKWTIAAGLAFGAIRFGLCAIDSKAWLLTGIILHGVSFTLVFITAQIYLDQRIDPSWRTRAQALYSVSSGGLGSLIGYLGTGAWFAFTQRSGVAHWPLFWGGLAVTVTLILVLFLVTYRGIGEHKNTALPANDP